MTDALEPEAVWRGETVPPPEIDLWLTPGGLLLRRNGPRLWQWLEADA